MKRQASRTLRLIATLAGVTMMLTGWFSGSALAASARQIDAGVDDAIVKFEQEVKGGKSFMESSKLSLLEPWCCSTTIDY